MATQRRAGLYVRVSTRDQEPETQLAPLRDFATARGWSAVEFVDFGVSGAKARRPALDAMMAAARARQIDVIAIVRLDRLARSVAHLVSVAAELEALGVDLVAMQQDLDTSTPAGRFLFHSLAAVAQLERDLIRERVLAGIRRAQTTGTRSGRRIGRPRAPVDIGRALEMLASGRRSRREVARTLGVSPATLSRALAGVSKPPASAPRASGRDRAVAGAV